VKLIILLQMLIIVAILTGHPLTWWAQIPECVTIMIYAQMASRRDTRGAG
jgi:hypothetical protein